MGTGVLYFTGLHSDRVQLGATLMMSMFTSLSSLLLGMTMVAASAGLDTSRMICSDPFVKVGDRCLFFDKNVNVPYSEAKVLCHDKKAELVTVLTPTHHKQLVDYINVNGLHGKDYWLDGTDEGTEGEWRTSSNVLIPVGTPFWYARTDVSEPNNAHGNENCLRIGWNYGVNYYMNDVKCTEYSSVICEQTPDRTTSQNLTTMAPMVDSAPRMSCPFGYFPLGGVCLALIWERLSYDSALAVCHEKGGDLMAITDIQLLRDVYLYIVVEGITHSSLWIGGTDIDDEGNWTWTTGEKVATGTPFWGTWSSHTVQAPDGGNEENCLALMAAGKHYFQDVSCDTKLYPLCMAKPVFT